MLVYGAHLLRNGAARVLDRMMAAGWLTHLATNGAGTIHDWEYAWFGASTESVEMGVAGGHFGTWHETASTIPLALMAGALDGLGYGVSLGKLIHEDGEIDGAHENVPAAVAHGLSEQGRTGNKAAIQLRLAALAPVCQGVSAR